MVSVLFFEFKALKDRILNEENKKYKGKIELQMSYEEMKEKFGEDATIS